MQNGRLTMESQHSNNNRSWLKVGQFGTAYRHFIKIAKGYWHSKVDCPEIFNSNAKIPLYLLTKLCPGDLRTSDFAL